MFTRNGFCHVTEDRRSSYRLETPQLTRGGQIQEESYQKHNEHWSENRKENRRRVGDHHEHRNNAPEHHEEGSECHWHHEIDEVHVFRETVQNATRWSRVEK